jgi:glycosyltransferase involved in cell wall biosynthesis
VRVVVLDEMIISIIICTRNRDESFHRAVASLFCPTNLEEPNWELLVVESSQDRTVEICHDFQQRFPGHFRFVREDKVGKSYALNTAIVEAKGDVLAFTDDDVLFASDYVRSIRTVFSSSAVDAAQGRVVLDCEGGWPKWLDETYALMADYRDYGQEVVPLKGTLCGTNMVIRKQLFEQVGGFAPELGPGGIGVFEDTEISLRMHENGRRLIYAPQILVRHQWARDRLTKDFIRKRMFLHGRVNAFYDNLPVSLGRFGLYVAKQIVSKEFQAAWELSMGRPAVALHRQCEAREQAGFFYQHWLFRRGVQRTFSRGSLSRPSTESEAVTPSDT